MSAFSNKATKAGIGYTLANVLIKGIGFATLPLFSRILSTEDFGIYNVFIAYDSVLCCCLGLALHSSVKSANWQFPKEIDSYISSVSLIYLLNMALLVLIALLFGSELSSVLGLNLVVIIALVFHSFGASITSLYNARVSLQYSYTKYMLVAGISSIGNILLSFVLIFTVFNNERYLGRIIGATTVVFLVGCALLALFWSKARPRYSKRYWSFGIHYSLPVVPHGISQIVLAQFDRLMINYMVSASAAGVYSLSANLMTILSVLTNSIGEVWNTWFFETMEGEEASNATAGKVIEEVEASSRREQIQSRSSFLACIFAVLTASLMISAPELILVLGGPEYAEAVYSSFGMLLSGYCVFLYTLIVAGEYYKQKTSYVMLGTMGAALINLVLNMCVISSFGYIYAAYTTFAAYMTYVMFHWTICRNLLGFSVLPVKTVVICMLSLFGALVICLLAMNYPIVRYSLLAVVLISSTITMRNRAVDNSK